MSYNKYLNTSLSDEYETPLELFNDLNSEFNFTLDPCASNLNHKCDKYFTKEDNGLIQDWSKDTVFCNPPYGKKIKLWVEKAYITNQLFNNTIVLLIPARTDTKWFHDYILNKAEIRFIRGRLKFNNLSVNAPFPSMIVIYK